MAKGFEGKRLFHTGAEGEAIRSNESQVPIEKRLVGYRDRLHESISKFTQINAALQGENFYQQLVTKDTLQDQLRLATFVLQNAPFVKKALAHIPEDEHALYLVAFGLEVIEGQQSLH